MKLLSSNALMGVLLSCFMFSAVANADWHDYYAIERIDYPIEFDPQISGLTVMNDGRLALTVIHGDVVIYNPESEAWDLFASGLHLPLGIVEEKLGQFLVIQKPELTRLIDTDDDGKADQYQTVYDDYGMTGNYHEFAFGPVVDTEGNIFIALNVASNFNGVFEYIRGEYSDLCPPKDKMQQWHNFEKWKQGYRKNVTRMFSCAPYRGWVMKIAPDGEVTPFASGFRSPAGMGLDDEGRLWVTDNQGDWIGTSPLHHVSEGDFAGHPASLHWKKSWQKPHSEIEASDLLSLRKPAAALFPHGELANSPTKPVKTIATSLFGLPKGEMLLGDMNQSHLIRYLPDEINGTLQGTLIPFLADDILGIGNYTMDFSSDGALWVGKVHINWAGGEGLLKITKKKAPFLVESVTLHKNGFHVTFNEPVDALPETVSIAHHTYLYHAKYGSEKVDVTNIVPGEITLGKSRKQLFITLDNITENRLYTIDLGEMFSVGGKPLMGSVLRYNLIKRVGDS